MPSGKRLVWIDVDPGHDDATEILLAIHATNIHLLGVSTVHGNAPHTLTTINAARCLVAFAADPNILVYPGAAKPLLRPAKHDAEIHGPDGLGGVEGLPDVNDPAVLARIARDARGEPVRALDGISAAVRDAWRGGDGEKVTVISSGPMTNIALFVAVYPDLLDGVEEFVFMGGAVGLGNRSSVAEYNIMCDPQATQIVLDAPVKTVMIPLNVTHTAIVTNEVHRRLLSPSTESSIATDLPEAETKLRHMLSTLITFFADAYKATFGFDLGPPLHDALTIAYVSQPELFKTKRYRVDVEMSGIHCVGETVVDMWNYRECTEETWGYDAKNCLVAEKLDVDGFFEMLLDCVKRCDAVSPLNRDSK